MTIGFLFFLILIILASLLLIHGSKSVFAIVIAASTYFLFGFMDLNYKDIKELERRMEILEGIR